MITKSRPFRGIYPCIGNNVYIDDSAVIIGDISLGDDVSIWPLVAARGDVNKISIGEGTNIQDGTILHVTRQSHSLPEGFGLTIGRHVTVGHGCILHGCLLGDRILVGMGVIVMDNATICDDVIIGAGSIVPQNKRLESGYLYVGQPVEQKRRLTPQELAFLTESANNYIELKNDYLLSRY